MLVLGLIFALAGVLQDPYPATYENAVQCTGIIGRIAATTGDEAAKVELNGRMSSLTRSAWRLGTSRGFPSGQMQSDIATSYHQAELLIPQSSQAEWSRAMADVLPIARQCLDLERRLVE